MKIIFSSTLYTRLKASECNGFLCGVLLPDQELLVSGCFNADINSNVDNIASYIWKMESFLPAGFDILGTFGEKPGNLEACSCDLRVHVQTLEGDEEMSAVDDKGGEVEIVICDDASAEEMIANDFVMFRLKTSMTIELKEKSNKFVDIQAKNEIAKDRSVFHMPKYGLLLKPHSLPGKYKLKSVGQIFPLEMNPVGDETSKPVQHMTLVETSVFEDGESTEFAPYIKSSYIEKQITSFPIEVNAVCFVPRCLELNELSEKLRGSLKRHKKTILNSYQLVSEDGVNLAVPQVYEFLLPGWLHQIRVCYPANKTDNQLAEFRREILHKVLMQPMMPLFRRNFAISIPPKPVKPQEKSTKIVCPHIGLDETRFARHQVAYVQGKYSYYHYKQDGIDDTGWGCAYRSLQTIISWAKFHGYYHDEVPTHKQIQEILVKIGDKPRRFIQSNSWIGSIEVQRVLEEVTGMTSRIVNLSSGPEISEKARELLIHFRTEGTPIMIGGGVLAHTIIGVAFDELSGNTEFLVLDPHYSGSEDLNTIHKKGWCNWKRPKFWNSRTFYNLCIPLRSNEV